jgi:hypothetical protein
MLWCNKEYKNAPPDNVKQADETEHPAESRPLA